MAKTTKKAPAKKAPNTTRKSNSSNNPDNGANTGANSALLDDLDSQEGVVSEVDEGEEDDGTIVATPLVHSERGAIKHPALNAPRKGGAVKETSRASSQPAKADFAAAHQALDLARTLSEREIARSAEGDARAAKRKLSEEPTTRFMVPFDIGEKHGAVITVTINGYRLSIKKGVLVEIPLSVADLLMKNLNVRSDVAEKFAMHRDESTEEALS